MGDRSTASGPLTLAEVETEVYRVGYAPDPFAWTPWEYANDGRFDGRWDDPNGMYRTLYVGATLLGCLLEVLADFRPDLGLAGELAAINDDEGHDRDYPTAAAGSVAPSWLTPRRTGTAQLVGEFVDVRAPLTLATLRTRFGALAAEMGLPDLDAAAIKLSEPRSLTQAISTWFYTTISPPVAGVCFGSRLADTVAMWAVFEYPGDDAAGSVALTQQRTRALAHDDPDLVEAFRIHGLHWAPEPPVLQQIYVARA